MITKTSCGGCGGAVVSAEPDPLNTNPGAGIAKTFEKDVTGEDIARCWHVACWERDLKRRGGDALPEPASVDWQAQIAAVLAEAEEGSS